MADLQLLAGNLKKKGYDAHIFPTRQDAARFLDAQIDGKTVGIGGSVTIRELDVFARLSAHNTVYWHDEKPEGLSVMETRRLAARAEVYLSSANGISLQGEIVNLDHTGNRVAALAFGPQDVYLVLGRNKVAPDLAAAIHRVRNVAAPLNARRLHRKTPCAARGDKCYQCSSPEKICRNLSVFLEQPVGAAYHVLLIDEDLGF